MKDAGSSWGWARNLFFNERPRNSKMCHLSFAEFTKKTKTKLSSDPHKCSQLTKIIVWKYCTDPILFSEMRLAFLTMLPGHDQILGFLNRNWWSSCPGSLCLLSKSVPGLLFQRRVLLFCPWPRWLNRVTWEGEPSKEQRPTQMFPVLLNAWCLNCPLVLNPTRQSQYAKLCWLLVLKGGPASVVCGFLIRPLVVCQNWIEIGCAPG